MPPICLSGRELAGELLVELSREVSALEPMGGCRLLVARAGNEPASWQYVRAIRRVAARAGIDVALLALPADISFGGFRDAVVQAAADPTVAGIQVQKPVPERRHTSEILEHLPPEKDVEGLHPENLGLLALGRPRFVPCTAAAVLRLLDYYKIDVEGKRAVVLGRSDIVGKPLATLLLARHATVTVCHTSTESLDAEVRRSDLLVAATGSPELVKATWLRPETIVVDVGHNVLSDGRTVGDVEPRARDVVAAWTPVPGGVGPLTVIELLGNVVRAARRAFADRKP